MDEQASDEPYRRWAQRLGELFTEASRYISGGGGAPPPWPTPPAGLSRCRAMTTPTTPPGARRWSRRWRWTAAGQTGRSRRPAWPPSQTMPAPRCETSYGPPTSPPAGGFILISASRRHRHRDHGSSRDHRQWQRSVIKAIRSDIPAAEANAITRTTKRAARKRSSDVARSL